MSLKRMSLSTSQWISTLLICALVIGVPLIINPSVRAVFEVTKLLWLRIITLGLGGIWLYQYLTTSSSNSNKTISRLGFKWTKIGLEIPMILWLIVNIISASLSQSFELGIIGSYDRWEGLITITNYILIIVMVAKLITRPRQIHWLLVSIIGASTLSAGYGIFQSLGYDVLFWSKDPTFRVFACINNPVHFCAYMGMTIPLALGFLLSLKRPDSIIKTSITSNNILVGITALSIAFGKWLFFDFGLDYLLFSSILGAICWISMSDQQLIPSKKTIISWTSLVGVIVIGLLLESFTFSKHIWTFIVGTGLILYCVAPYPHRSLAWQRLLFVSICLIFYSQILSFSRATWIGFSLAMPLLYTGMTHNFSTQTTRRYFLDIVSYVLMLAGLILVFIFKLHSTSFIAGVSLTTLLILTFFIQRALHRRQSIDLSWHNHSIEFFGYFILFFILLFPFSELTLSYVPHIKLILLAGFFILTIQPHRFHKTILERMVIGLMFIMLQFTGKSIFFALFYGVCLGLYYLVSLKKESPVQQHQKYHLLLALIAFGMIMAIPTIPTLITNAQLWVQTQDPIMLILSIGLLFILALSMASILLKTPLSNMFKKYASVMIFLLIGVSLPTGIIKMTATDSQSINSLDVAKNINKRTSNYESQLQESARISMWKSAIPWFKDFPWFGSGPDTIKYFYPVYRRPEYGILEGGHNYTPDRLHNEYLNTLVTRGSIGFLVYFLGIIVGWFYILLKTIRHKTTHSTLPILLGCISCSVVYLGQVLFNFGVVATLVLFYVVMGLGLSLSNNTDFYDDSTQ